MDTINEDLLSAFERNLLCHTVSVSEHFVRVNAYSLATKSGLFFNRYLEGGSAHEPLILTPDDAGSVGSLKVILYFCHFDCLPDMDIPQLRDVLTAAVHFQSRQLEQYATEFACSRLTLETANSIWQQVHTLPHLPVTETVRAFVLRHFLTLAQRQDFGDFSADTMVDLLRDERLNAWQEDLLVEPLLRWLRGRPTPIWEQMLLLSSLRFDLLTQRTQAALSQMDGFQYFSGFRRSPMFSGICQSPDWRRPHEVLLKIGGRHLFGEPTDEVYLLHPRDRTDGTHRWMLLAPRFHLPEPRINFGCAVLNDCRVIVAGGCKAFKPREHTAECLCLDLRSPRAAWRPIAALHEARSRLATVVCCSVLYAIGGENPADCLATVEALDEAPPPQQKGGSGGSRWRLRAPLPVGRSAPGLACVAGRVIACGGYRRQFDSQPLDLVDSYDPGLDQWTRLAPMRHPRGGPSLLALPGEHPQLLVLGGNSVAGAERMQFNAASGCRWPLWVPASPAPAQHFNASVGCVVDSRWVVVAMGDNAGEGVLTASFAVPIEQLCRISDDQPTAVPESVPWFRGMYAGDFALATVGGLDSIDRLLEGAICM